MLVDETANATIAPGLASSKRDTIVDIIDFHVAHTHAHEGALRKTAKQVGVTLEGKLHECKSCSIAERTACPSHSTKTNSRGDKRLSRVFVNLGGNKNVTSMGGNKYPRIISDGFLRYAWLYFISHRSDTTKAFKQFLADLRVKGIPSEAAVVRQITLVSSPKENTDSFAGKKILNKNSQMQTAQSPMVWPSVY